MGHYTGPKARVNRRLGCDVYDSSGATRASRRRPNPPGMHGGRRRRPTDYGRALTEKQKVRHYYGLSQRQLIRIFELAKRAGGNKGANLLQLCERRLDNILWRSGLARTRSQARQSATHSHFLVNGRRMNVPSYLVEVGDVIQVRKREKLQKLYASRTDENDRPGAEFIAVDPKELTIRVLRFPEKSDVSLPVNINLVVEFLGR
jgi:small subunit ribosomal protein S4